MIIRPYIEEERNELLLLWEKSVLATHDFLDPVDFQSIKVMLSAFDFANLEVHGLWSATHLLGFVAGIEGKLEMLFVHPHEQRKGYGSILLDFAMDRMDVNFVDVNEQNLPARRFYEAFGFHVQERSPVDSMGMPYPILHLKKSEA